MNNITKNNVVCAVLILILALACFVVYAQFISVPPLFRQWRFAVTSETLPQVFINGNQLICRTAGVDFIFPAPPSGAAVEIIDHDGAFDSFYGSLLISWSTEDEWVPRYKNIFIQDNRFVVSNTNSHKKFAINSNPERGVNAMVELNNTTSIIVRVSCFGDI